MRYLRKIKELNQVEQWKLERHPLDVRDAVVNRYALEGPEAIKTVPGEVERLKWVGLYPQRQGGDAFMLRIKVPGGRLDAAQARVVGEVADEFARGPAPNPVFGDAYLDITTRQDIQLHWIRIGAVPEIWRRLEAAGMTTVQACGDSARNVLCCPVSGLDADEVLDAHPVAAAVSAYFTGNREYANLPRKFKLSVTGCREDCAQAEINDIGLWPAWLGDGTVGFNLLVGGGLSSRPTPAGWSSCSGQLPSSSASWATARTAGWPGCATWSRSSAPSGSGPSWPGGPRSPSSRPARPSPAATAATTSGCTRRSSLAAATSA
jgi:ferredoxin-nitrite reductase